MDRLKFAMTLGLASISCALTAQEHRGIFETFDSDGNGSVSFAEFQENDTKLLARIDTDANGVLTLDEFLNAGAVRGLRHNKRRGENHGEKSNQATKEKTEEQTAARRANMSERATAAFQEMDLDGDEIVSVAEFQEATFLRMDRDSNAVLTVEELRPPRGHRSKGRKGDRTPPA